MVSNEKSEKFYIPNEKDLSQPFVGYLETGEKILIKQIFVNPYDKNENNEFKRTKQVTSLIGVPQLRGFYQEPNTTWQGFIVMEKLSPYVFTLESVHVIIGNLKKLHDNKIFHMDITPNNIIQTQDGQIGLINFGIDNRPSKFFYPMIETIIIWGNMI
jgi:serine/threonine protein kinase